MPGGAATPLPVSHLPPPRVATEARLCVSRATVKFHCGNVFAKLGVESRAQAIATAYTCNLVPRLVTASDQTDRSTHLVEHKPVSRSA